MTERKHREMEDRKRCNTPSVTMAMAHLYNNDCDHMWKKLKEKSIRTLETMD